MTKAEELWEQYQAGGVLYRDDFLAALKKYGDALRKDAERFRGLQNMDPKVAQSFFWNYTSRKQRAAAIDAAMERSE